MRTHEIREATPLDRDLFLDLWGEYLRDLEKVGGEIVPNEKAIRTGGAIFDAYVSGELDGVVLLAEDVGFVLWGEANKEPLFDFSWGRAAQGWGTYVRSVARTQGVASSLRSEAKRRLCKMGFDAIVGTTHNQNEPGILSTAFAGFHGYSSNVVLRF